MPALLPPVTLAEVSAEWLAERREIVVRCGHALRAGPLLATIEVEALPRAKERAVWCTLGLPGGGKLFDSTETRDAVLLRLRTDPVAVKPNSP